MTRASVGNAVSLPERPLQSGGHRTAVTAQLGTPAQATGLAVGTTPFAIAGMGTALPDRVVTNHDFASYLDTSDEWIATRTGIRERRVAGPGESTGPLATLAARRALENAGLGPSDLDTIIVATTTPEQPIPSTAAWLAAQLGSTSGAFDLNGACAGFVYGLVVAGGMLQTGASRTVLLVGADTMSRYVDQEDRSSAVLFGDGAGAVVLTLPDQLLDTELGLTPLGPETSGQKPVPGLVSSDLIDDPAGVGSLVVPAGGSAEPASHETVDAKRHYLQMEGSEVFRRAVRGVSDSVNRTLERAGATPADVDLFVPHQANARIIDAVLGRTGLDPAKTVQTVDRHGNTSAASVPLALAEAVDQGRLRDGDLLLTSGFGAGLTIGTALLRWGAS